MASLSSLKWTHSLNCSLFGFLHETAVASAGCGVADPCDGGWIFDEKDAAFGVTE